MVMVMYGDDDDHNRDNDEPIKIIYCTKFWPFAVKNISLFEIIMTAVR